jgi:hypothetical protein
LFRDLHRLPSRQAVEKGPYGKDRTMPVISRRKAIKCLGGLAGSAVGAVVLPAGSRIASGQASQPSKAGTRVITLGTQGGPFPQAHRAQSSNLLLVNGTHYIIDAGDGVARRLAKGKFSIPAIGTIFLTHLHDDHTAGLQLRGIKTEPVRSMSMVRRELTNWSRPRSNISPSAPRSGSTTVERQCRCPKCFSVMMLERASSSKTQISK